VETIIDDGFRLLCCCCGKKMLLLLRCLLQEVFCLFREDGIH
jgi:hypothetical protein